VLLVRIDTRPTTSFLRHLTPAEYEQLVRQGCSGSLDEIRIAPAAERALRQIARTNFRGTTWILSPDLDVRDSDVDASMLGAATVARSRVERSLLGDHVVVEAWSVVRDSVLAPFKRRTQLPTGATRADLFGVTVEQSQVSASVVWGGTDIGPFASVRPNSIVGPFVHVGTGSEIKSSWLIGGSPLHRVEVPHRSYIGNARIRAVRLAQRRNASAHVEGVEEVVWGSPAWTALWEEALRVIRRGVWLDATHLGIEGAVQPRSLVRFRLEDRETLVELESVNLGALFTTSNFDPRGGGLKMPTEIGGGAKLGVLTWAQAPCVIGEGSLTASGSKAFLDAVRTDSLAFGGAGEHAVKEGYFTDAAVRLGDGIEEGVKIALGYLTGIDAGIRVASQAAAATHGIARVAWHAEADTLLAAREESLKWLTQFQKAISRSINGWAKADGPNAAARRADHKRALDRLVTCSPAPTIECREADATDLAEALSVVPGGVRPSAFDALTHDDLSTPWADVARATAVAASIARELDEHRAVDSRNERASTAPPEPRAPIPRIFGTSGIRGAVRESSRTPLADYAAAQTITPELGALLGRAFALALKTRGEGNLVSVFHDVRPSSLSLAAAVLEGLVAEDARVEWGGAQSTPTATRQRDRAVVVVTASHNPPTENGFKFFLRGHPIDASFEDEVQVIAESLDRAPETARPNGNRALAVKNVSDAVRSATRAVLLRNVQRLGLSGALAGRIVVLDLAHGAAATYLGGNGLAPRLSPGLEAVLATGAVVVGFAAEQDPAMVNIAVGAAYPYGECRTAATPDSPAGHAIHATRGEILEFARGAHGYGAGEVGTDAADGWRPLRSPARKAPHRSVYFPAGYAHPPGPVTAQLTRFAGGCSAIIGFDRDAALRKAVEKFLEPFGAPIVAAAVDCDADRLLVTDADLATQNDGFLDGDRMLATLVAASQEVAEVVVTCESGIGAARVAAERGIPVVRTTVGDRAVGTALLRPGAAERIRPGQFAIGAEPSGHILIAERDASREGAPQIVDDPFEVLLRIVAVAKRRGTSLASIARESCAALEDDVVVRKPEAWAISLDDKRRLTLGAWRENGTVHLSNYARAHIDFVARRFAAIAADVGLVAAPPAIRLPDEVLSGERTVLASAGDITIALRASAETYRGADDIVIEVAQDSATIFESVSRNSGTSPKNACYWKANVRGNRATAAAVGAALEKAAADRVAFTLKWLEQNRS
jgi:phosphomannomutase